MAEASTRPSAGTDEPAGAARYELRLGGDPGNDQHEETFEVRRDGVWSELRCHDYAEIFSLPGLYEQLFHDELDCRSPEAVTRALREVLAAIDDPCHAAANITSPTSAP